jgi:hypothetical protein
MPFQPYPGSPYGNPYWRPGPVAVGVGYAAAAANAAIEQANAAAQASAVNAANRAPIISSIQMHLAAANVGATPDAAGHIAAVQQMVPLLA